jgi:pyruvate,orthophosphate dikinase
MRKFVYDFSEGNKDLKELLGGKGANLAEMTNMGLPLPPGFTITSEACQAYLPSGQEPPELAAEVAEHLASLEATMGKRLGQSDDPLLVSVRSGADRCLRLRRGWPVRSGRRGLLRVRRPCSDRPR